MDRIGRLIPTICRNRRPLADFTTLLVILLKCALAMTFIARNSVQTSRPR